MPLSNDTGTRQLKVYTRHISRAGGGYTIVPEIRLSGRWLEKAGFTGGCKIVVDLKDDKIVITIRR